MRGISVFASSSYRCNWRMSLFLLVVLVLSCQTNVVVVGQNKNNDYHNINNYLVQYEENHNSYVDYPDDTASQAILQQQHSEAEEFAIPKVTLNLWSTVVDFRHPLFYLVKGIVRRLDKELIAFVPQYYIRDGLDLNCRYKDEVTGEELENVTTLVECRRNCTNYGRYCAASLPQQPELARKINGAAVVEESLRRLCGTLF